MLLGMYDSFQIATVNLDTPLLFKTKNLGVGMQSLPSGTWTNMQNSYYVNNCAGATKALLTVPMLVGPQVGTPLTNSGSGQTTSPWNPAGSATPTTMTLADVASGVWDTQFTAVFQAIANVRPDAILRIGWEIYGNGWYPWNGPALFAAHRLAWIHLVGVARAVSSSFQFDWNGGARYQALAGYDPMTGGAWPGAAYVDYITYDVYDTWGTGDGGAVGWGLQAANLAEGLAFAATNGKPFCIPELGLGTLAASNAHGDDYQWLLSAYKWARANQAALGYVNFFNWDGSMSGGNNFNSLQQNPNSMAVWTSLFAAWNQQLQGQTSHRFVSSTGLDRLRVA